MAQGEMAREMKKDMNDEIFRRKEEHIDLCLKEDVQSLQSAGWDQIRLPHCALPELDLAQITTDCSFLGRDFAAPFMISSMSGGSPAGEKLNQTLGEFAQRANLPMGVGSQRIALENRDKKLFDLRKVAPKATLYANIGLVQLNCGVSVEDCQWLVDSLEAQALIVHLNPLQEAVQENGNTRFSGLLLKLSELAKRVSVPLILKETGCGLDPLSAKRALEAGVAAFDAAGLGGTHWGYIEGLRTPSRAHLGEMFRSWGRPSAAALVDLRAALGPSVPIVASGGLRNGLDAAKALHLGADFVAMALPFLQAAQSGVEGLETFLKQNIEALKIALFCSGRKAVRTLSRHGKL